MCTAVHIGREMHIMEQDTDGKRQAVYGELHRMERARPDVEILLE